MNGSKFDWLGKWLSRLGLLYLLPPLLIIFDESVLKTSWISNHIPRWLDPPFRTIYPWLEWMYAP